MRQRVAEAFHVLSLDLSTGRAMVEAGVAPTLVALCSSNTERIRTECVSTLFNLSRVPGCERSLVDAGASKALMVVALLRSHQSSTQRLSMQAVHNLMADDAVRMQVLDQGGVFGLLKLAGAHNPVTQRVCALTMYHLVHEYAPRQALVEGGCIRGMVRALNHMDCFYTPSGTTLLHQTLSSANPPTPRHVRMRTSSHGDGRATQGRRFGQGRGRRVWRVVTTRMGGRTRRTRRSPDGSATRSWWATC